jgi:hypothetical protein
MKSLVLSAVAFVALSGAALADQNRSNDLRDSPTYTGKYAASSSASVATSVDSAFVVPGHDAVLNNFERLNRTSEANEHGGR